MYNHGGSFIPKFFAKERSYDKNFLCEVGEIFHFFMILCFKFKKTIYSNIMY